MGKSFSSLVTLVILSLFAVSCGSGGPQVLTGIKVSTSTVNDDLMLGVSADLNLGAMSLPAATIPIIHPHGNAVLGQVELLPVLGGSNQIKISVNVTELADVNTSQAVLPNGNMIPLIASNPTVAVNLGRGAKLYLTLGNNVAAIGVAVPISSFDSIGSKLPGLNIFPVLNVENIVATAGVFTGAQAGQNGIALIADVSKVINLGDIFKSASFMQAEVAREDEIQLDYRSHSASADKKRAFDMMIYQMNKQRTQLKLH